MNDNTIQARFVTKKEVLEKKCIYGLTHFCDGRTNMSAKGIENGVTPKKRCPKYYDCEIRKHSIFEERNTDDETE